MRMAFRYMSAAASIPAFVTKSPLGSKIVLAEISPDSSFSPSLDIGFPLVAD